MRPLARQLSLLVLAALLSWWFLLRSPTSDRPLPPNDRILPIALTPRVSRALPAGPPPERPADGGPPAAPIPEPASQEPVAAAGPDPGPAPAPPPERGTPEGDPGIEARPPAPDRETAATATRSDPPRSEELMSSAELLEEARDELAGPAARGFETVLLSAPEEQLEIARFFGEEVLLVPRSALDPGNPRPTYFRVSLEPPSGVEQVAGRPPLESYRPYRDLFDYEYSRLPGPLRNLRRSVLSRSEVYLFAALVPAREWAVVVGRRAAALDRVGASLSQVRRFRIRYVRRPDGGFDLQVEDVLLADGRRLHVAGSGTPSALAPGDAGAKTP